ncbi:MAG: VOC family protein [Candidatus Brocadiaceae bacterium]|jgi:glyoxylase I family protein
MARTVQHVALSCRSRVDQERFYSRHFGFERARVFKAGQPDEFVMLKLGDVRMELFQAEDTSPDDHGGPQKVGFKHMCFGVEDVAAKAAELEADGLEPGPVIDCSDQVPGLKVCFLRDPEQNVIELMEGWRDDPGPPDLE